MSPKPTPDPCGPVARLRPRDTLRIDAEPLLRLQSAEGPQAAHALVARTREDLGHRLDRMAGFYARGALGPLAAEAGGVAAAAQPVGLTDLARVAGHVADCAGRNDPAALAATVARLSRLGERALALIGNLRAPG